MTRRRWIADEVWGNRAVLTGEHARHLAQVLRARVGQEFEISTGAEIRHGRVAAISADRVEFDLGALVSHSVPTRIAVAISIFKFDRMEWAIEKCTELGVAKIIPMISARTESHLASAALKRTERWQRIAKQASEQSRRISSPEVCSPIKVRDLLTRSTDTRIVLSEIEETLQLADAISQTSNSVLLAFGPEGGWKEEELTAFRNAGWASASLGKTILRTETAVIAAVAIAIALLPKNQEPTTNS